MVDVKFLIGEVESYSNTYREPTTDEYSVNLINVLVKDRDHPYKISDVHPASVNSKQLPLIGEHVLIFEGLAPFADYNNRVTQYYYLTTIAMQSNVNDNRAFVNDSNYILTQDSNYELKENASTKQPFIGDVLIEGRWGNSIRLGSTSKSDDDTYTVNPSWLGSLSTDPIIILSNNSKTSTNKNQLTVENVETDDSVLYLTSKQKITNFTLGSKNNKNSLSCFTPSESEFNRSQFIGIADRVILKAKTDIAVIDAEKGIVLNTTNEIKLGNDEANESMVHGNVLMQLLQHIILQLQSSIVCGVELGAFTDFTNANKAQELMQQLLSSKYFMKKVPY